MLRLAQFPIYILSFDLLYHFPTLDGGLGGLPVTGLASYRGPAWHSSHPPFCEIPGLISHLYHFPTLDGGLGGLWDWPNQFAVVPLGIHLILLFAKYLAWYYTLDGGLGGHLELANPVPSGPAWPSNYSTGSPVFQIPAVYVFIGGPGGVASAEATPGESRSIVIHTHAAQ